MSWIPLPLPHSGVVWYRGSPDHEISLYPCPSFFLLRSPSSGSCLSSHNLKNPCLQYFPLPPCYQVLLYFAFIMILSAALPRIAFSRFLFLRDNARCWKFSFACTVVNGWCDVPGYTFAGVRCSCVTVGWTYLKGGNQCPALFRKLRCSDVQLPDFFSLDVNFPS